MRRRICGLAVLLVVCSLTVATQQQTRRPVFRGGTDLVQLDVVVLDKNRHPITGLAATDFIVLEEGRPRPIQAFAPVTLPAPETAVASTRAATALQWPRKDEVALSATR